MTDLSFLVIYNNRILTLLNWRVEQGDSYVDLYSYRSSRPEVLITGTMMERYFSYLDQILNI